MYLNLEKKIGHFLMQTLCKCCPCSFDQKTCFSLNLPQGLILQNSTSAENFSEKFSSSNV
jgi:hypothetical protein